MNILGGLDVPSAGRAVVAGHVLGQMGRSERTRYRRRVIGFVWQQTARNLLPYLTARQNVELPMLLNGVGRGEREPARRSCSTRSGWPSAADHRPDRLSGGEQQRVGDRGRAGERAGGALRGRADRRARHDHGARGVRRAAERQPGARRDHRRRHPRPARQRAGQPHGRHPRRADQHRDAAPARRSRDAGDHHVISEEYAVLDRVGRLQLPRAYVEALGLERRVRLALEPDHISVWPDRDALGGPYDRRPARSITPAGRRGCA